LQKFALSLLSLCFLSPTFAYGHNQISAIYDDNQRMDLNAVQDANILKLAESTVAMFKAGELVLHGNVYGFDKTTMEKNLKLCPKQEFGDQPSAADCSGVLVGEDKLYTAGHCVTNRTCAHVAFAFGYANLSTIFSPDALPASEVYFCKEVIARSNTDNLDYAIIRLDRPVTNHVPVKIARERVQPGQRVFLLSHPGGAPLKYSPPAEVISSTANHFTAGMSALGGSSGGGVFLESTHELVGILVSGEDDYVHDRQKRCRRVHVCAHGGKCKGEESTHVDVITE
jgi:hypothetical protein